MAPRLVAFWRFFRDHVAPGARMALSVRDLLAWAAFVNTTAPRLGEAWHDIKFLSEGGCRA